jgi:SagB-type dehydrogenase family enzyme
MRTTETATQALHRLTSFPSDPDWDEPFDLDADPRLLHDFVALDVERVPWPYKHYEDGLPRRELPVELPTTSHSALSALAGTAEGAAAKLDLAQLARLLHLSSGVVRFSEWAPAHRSRLLYRASGSAGGRYPLEVYVAVPEGTELPTGVHWYDPEAHVLVEVGPTPSGEAPAIIVTGIPWRTGWKYRERGFRHIYWDAGSMLAQLLALASVAGLGPRLITRFPDATVDSLVGADGVDEFSVAVVSLGSSTPSLEGSGTAIRGAVDRDPVEFPFVTEAQRAGRADVWGEPWADGEPAQVADAGPTLDEVVLRRSSLRLMNRTRGLPNEVLTNAMSVAMRGVAVPHWVAVHDVRGVTPGLYRWPDLEKPLRTGDLRSELYRVGGDQGLPRDAAFVAVSGARTAELDDREYREAQLAAGIVEGRLHLAAYAHGAGASGMTFVDADIPDFLGEPYDALLLTCVGVPEYKSRPGGPPRSPTPIRPVRTRIDDA